MTLEAKKIRTKRTGAIVMESKILRFCVSFFFLGCVAFAVLGRDVRTDLRPCCAADGVRVTSSSLEDTETQEKKISESWMGIYMDGVKIGYSLHQEFSLIKNGQRYTKEFDESWMRVTRLGGNPVELTTVQESFSDAQGRPLECVLRTKMSESETVMRAEVRRDKIVFKSEDKIIKEIPYDEPFYFGIPLQKIIDENGLKPGKKFSFKILDFTTYSLVNTSFEVIGKEDVLILGQLMNLWHIKGQIESIIPISSEEWIDERGNSLKSVSKASFMNLTSIQMPKEKAIEVSDENFDIAFSTVIQSNVEFENPQKIQGVTFKLSGIPLDRIQNLPFEGRSQRILELGKDYAVIQTFSQMFREKDAVLLPITGKRYQDFLKSTSFCQSDDPEIQKEADEIVAGERNSWMAAKKIAEWVSREITPNYDVAFADAIEIIKNREGDCSEHTVITVALCRAAGIPARAAVGVMYGRGIFAYHMWPEVFVGQWISLDPKWLAVDKKTGEYYTDATHIKFGHSVLDENIFQEMAQAVAEIIGQLKLEIIDYCLDK